ncbi:N-acetylmuramoyl-L-alanine amidase LytC precursor [Caloramator mitchellensis]|uniref:N-acetylmuramoyl-L-alanine amidase LytC n=1 Tax=Caloramator mitchellensis TaxID=908809 RepID=A0A0R3JW38_CALMK|nr:N-acetylmuramoyl-L-alanine amidase [Caloramator mitchellensis]KRQ87782.1 N-acetylmuramoyl-L-alanine amidase LytC precursor [Caloramator mitchellensis]
MDDLRLLLNGKYIELEMAVLYHLSSFQEFFELEIETLKAISVLLRSKLCRGIRNLIENEKVNVELDENNYINLNTKLKEKINKAVSETEGLIVKYNNKIIDFYYTMNCSGGTANSEDVLGVNIPYLRRVLCNKCPRTKREVEFEIKDIENKLGMLNGNYKNEIPNFMENVERDETGRIINLDIRTNKTSGKEFAERMNLKSNRIYFMQKSISIKEIGDGMGLGICIQGANNLAKEGCKFNELIKYYFTGVEIIRLDKEYILNNLYDKKIVIDAGHGGSDFGKVNDSLIEKDINLKIALKLKYLLESKGCIIILTREKDEYLSLLDRVNIINKERPNFFISIHQNSFINDTVNGAECYCFKDDDLALELSKEILEKLKNKAGIKNRGVRVGDYYILREGRVSGIVLECLYLTGNVDREKYDEEGLEKIAKAVFEGICEYYDVRV